MATDELDVLLDQLGRQHFLIQQFRDDLRGLDVVTALYDWGGAVADVLIVRGDEDGTAFRALTGPGTEVYNPPHVLWSYANNAVWTVRALLTLPRPGRAHRHPHPAAGIWSAGPDPAVAGPVMSKVVWTAGLLERDCDTVGDPRVLSWLSISPDGQLTQRSTGNGQGYLLGYNIWAQWELIRAVRGVIYPPNKDWQRLRLRTQMFNTGAPGVVVASYPHPRNDQPFNRVAAAMVTAVMPSVSSWWPLRGEVAWVGPLSTPDGLHASLSGQHLTTLEDLAEVVGRGIAR